MYFIGENAIASIGTRVEFYDDALLLLQGDISASDWVPSGAASAVQSGFLAAVPREIESCGWSAALDRTPHAAKVSRGGRRPGSGRKPLDADGTIVTTLRLTGKQKATFDMLGGKDWLRGQLDLFGGDA